MDNFGNKLLFAGSLISLQSVMFLQDNDEKNKNKIRNLLLMPYDLAATLFGYSILKDRRTAGRPAGRTDGNRDNRANSVPLGWS